MDKKFVVTVTTNGACRCNPGPGAYYGIMRCGSHKKDIYGFESQTSNNRMELEPVIEAIVALKKPSTVIVRTKSKFVCNCIDSMEERAQNDYHTKTGAKCMNYDQQKRLYAAVKAGGHTISSEWISDPRDEDNNTCSKEAQAIIKKRVVA